MKHKMIKYNVINININDKYKQKRKQDVNMVDTLLIKYRNRFFWSGDGIIYFKT